jgi:hypothetical protein
VPDAASSLLTDWENFYVIVGSSAAGLIGLQFVVIALVTETRTPSTIREIDAFATPTIIHFGSSLLLSAILSAPWRALENARVVLLTCGVVGLLYLALVIRRIRSQTTYQLVTEDWIWHVTLPLVAYVMLVVGAAELVPAPHESLFAIAATALLLLFIGIHNAWDTVTYIALDRPQSKPNRFCRLLEIRIAGRL